MADDKLDSSLLEEMEAHAIHVAREAGKILLQYFRSPLDVQFKGKKKSEPVTAADNRVEEYLKTAISTKFPEHGILSEEGGMLGKPDSAFLWVVDPLDGTCNFTNGLPLFAVSIGVFWKGQPVVGSIYVPVSHCAKDGVYHACLHKGAYLDSERIAVTRTSTGRPLSAMPFQFGSRFVLSGQSASVPHEVRNTGSIALELALTACGVFQYALFSGPRIWDIAAGILLVKEAGGSVFTRLRKGMPWLPLESFDLRQGKLEGLRNWSAPVLAGTSDITNQVMKDIRAPHSPLSWLATLQRRRAGRTGNS